MITDSCINFMGIIRDNGRSKLTMLNLTAYKIQEQKTRNYIVNKKIAKKNKYVISKSVYSDKIKATYNKNEMLYK